jgi:hypothetical protein
MRKLLTTVLLTTLALPAAADEAATWSGNAMMAPCRASIESNNDQNFLGQGLCLGFFSGMTYTTLLRPAVCIPDGVTPGQVIRVVIRNLDQQPARLHEDFRDLAMEALIATWPCKK